MRVTEDDYLDFVAELLGRELTYDEWEEARAEFAATYADDPIAPI